MLNIWLLHGLLCFMLLGPLMQTQSTDLLSRFGQIGLDVSLEEGSDMPRRQTQLMLVGLRHLSGLQWPREGDWDEDGLPFPSKTVFT